MEEPRFRYRFYEADQPKGVYHNHLPHWRQEGALYFVTFRLADSIPAAVLNAWAEEQHVWLVANGVSPHLPKEEQEAVYQQIPTPVRHAFEKEQQRRFHTELDKCHGDCPLRDREMAGLVRDAMLFFHEDRLHCGDFVVMPNHVHWVVAPYAGHDLERLCGSVKRFCARQINERTHRKGQFWQHESFDHLVRDATQLQRIRDFIRDNPQKAGLSAGTCVYHRADWIVDLV